MTAPNSTSAGLFPGYRQVEAFEADEEYELDSEEVVFVTLDVGDVEPSLVPGTSSYRLIGLDSATPFLQLSGTIFQGRHDDLLGSELLFRDDSDEQDRTKKAVAHVGTTSRRIRFHEVELQPKAGADDNGVQKTLGLPKGSSSKRRRNAKGKTRVEKTDEADAVMDEETPPALRHSGRQGVPSTTAKEKAKARESLIFGGSENPIQNDDYIGEEVEEENGVDNGKDD